MRVLDAKKTAITATAALAILAASASADDPTTWPFSIATEGEDVNWVSPSAVRADAATYVGEYEITGAWVTVMFLGNPIEVEVTDQIPPEYLSGSGEAEGPAPLLLFDESIVYPEPPEDPAIAADLTIGLDTDGFGYLDATNIILGSIDVGFGDIDIEAIRFEGTITVTPVGVSNPSDINGDGVVDVFDLLILLGVWGSDDPAADLNGDGVVDVFDLLILLGAWG